MWRCSLCSMVQALHVRSAMRLVVRIVDYEPQPGQRMVAMLDVRQVTSDGNPPRGSPEHSSRRSGKASSMAAMNMSPATPPTASRWRCMTEG